MAIVDDFTAIGRRYRELSDGWIPNESTKPQVIEMSTINESLEMLEIFRKEFNERDLLPSTLASMKNHLRPRPVPKMNRSACINRRDDTRSQNILVP